MDNQENAEVETSSLENKQPTQQKKGVINPATIRGIAFAITTICIMIGVTVSIMAIWDYADKDVLYRTLGTLGVVSLGVMIFTAVNEAFGGKG